MHQPAVTALKATDELLFSPLSIEEKVVLAATLGYPRRNPSLSQLVAATGLHRDTVKRAQDQLEALRDVNGEKVTALTNPRPRPAALYDKPSSAHDRNPENPRFARSNRLAWVERDYDPDHAPVPGGGWIELPASVNAKLPRGHKNSGLIRLVALYYAREQLHRGAIQVEDSMIATDLGLHVLRNGFYEELNTRQVGRVKEALLTSGVLVVHDPNAAGGPVYVMPGATPAKPEAPENFQPEWTKRARYHAGADLDVHATDSQWEKIARLLRLLGDDRAGQALVAAGLYAIEDHEAEPVIAALEAALDRSEDYDRPFRGLRPTVQRTKTDRSEDGASSTTTYHLPPTPSGRDSDDKTDGAEPESARQGERKDGWVGKQAGLDGLPETAALLRELFPEGVPGNIAADFAFACERLELANGEEPLNTEQAAAVDQILSGRLYTVRALADDQRERFARARAVLRRASTDEDVVAALRRHQPPPVDLGDLYPSIPD